jgi:hypothetical protein
MTTAPDPQIARLEYTVREQMALMEQMQAEIDRLVDWIMGDKDALACLQAVYNDTTASESNRIKAASSAIGFERPKMMATNLVLVDFRERVRQARLKAPLVEPEGDRAHTLSRRTSGPLWVIVGSPALTLRWRAASTITIIRDINALRSEVSGIGIRPMT